MKQHIVTCRICKEKFDTNKLIEDIEWIMPSPKFYYHKKCYEDWAKKKDKVSSTGDSDLYFDASWRYLKEELHINPDFHKIKKQWDSCIAQGMTAKGIYFTLRYFYEIEKGDKEKSQRGIGIVPYVYSRATTYWGNRERTESGICDRIEEQLRKANNQTTMVVKKVIPKKKNKKIDLAALADLEDEE